MESRKKMINQGMYVVSDTKNYWRNSTVNIYILAALRVVSGFFDMSMCYFLFFLLLQYRMDGSGMIGLEGFFQQHVRESGLVIVQFSSVHVL